MVSCTGRLTYALVDYATKETIMATIISRPRSSENHDAALVYALTGILFALVVGIFVFSVVPAFTLESAPVETAGASVEAPATPSGASAE